MDIVLPSQLTCRRREEGKRTKDGIIALLCSQHPLTARQVWRRLMRRGPTVTYKAVYKALQELSERNVLVKNELEYELDLEWASSLRSFADAIQRNYARVAWPGRTQSLEHLSA